jgi:hypothetical protein
MSTETETKEGSSKKTKKITASQRQSAIAKIVSAMHDPKELRELLSEDAVATRVAKDLYTAQGVVLPLPGRLNHRMSLNPVYSYGKAAVGVTNTVQAVISWYDWGKKAKEYLFPL